MAYAYFKNGMHTQPAIFEAFFRKCPFNGNYAIFAGLDEVIEFLERFKFKEDEISFLKERMPADTDPAFFEYLSSLDSSEIKMSGMLEGTIVVGSEPLLTFSGPIGLIQLIETPILNLINFSTLICTNACRMVYRAGPKVKCLEFGLRRAQGPNGGMTASKYSYLGGFAGTSNVLAGKNYGIEISGTIAHSFIMAFDDINPPTLSLFGLDLIQELKAIR